MFVVPPVLLTRPCLANSFLNIILGAQPIAGALTSQRSSSMCLTWFRITTNHNVLHDHHGNLYGDVDESRVVHL